MKYIKLYEGRKAANSTYNNYSVHHDTDNMSSADYFWDLNKAISRAYELIKKGHTSNVEIFKNGLHSTTQEEYLVKWWGRGYWYNIARTRSAKGDLNIFKKYLYGIEKALWDKPHFNIIKIIGDYMDSPESFKIIKDKEPFIWSKIKENIIEIIGTDYKLYDYIRDNIPDIWNEIKNNPDVNHAADLGYIGFSDD